MPDGQVLSTASIQCATVVAFDDLDENTVNLANHVPDFGFLTWEEFVSGQFAGEFNTMANLTVNNVIARSGEDVAIDGVHFRIQVDTFRGATDGATQRSRLVFLGRGADTIAKDGGFERIEVGWERVDSTNVAIHFRRFNAADVEQETAQIGSNFSLPINSGAMLIVFYEHPTITVYTAPDGQSAPKTLIGSTTITGDLRGVSNQRIGIESGQASSQRSFFDALTVYSLGPSVTAGETQAVVSVEVLQNGVVQIPADMRVIQQNVIFVNASINASILINSEVSVNCSINALQQNEVQVVASINLLAPAPGQVFVGSTIDVIQRGQVVFVSSLEAALNGQESVVMSIQVDQRINGQVSAQASSLVKHSGAIEDPILEDNRVVVIEHGAQTELPILWRD